MGRRPFAVAIIDGSSPPLPKRAGPTYKGRRRWRFATEEAALRRYAEVIRHFEDAGLVVYGGHREPTTPSPYVSMRGGGHYLVVSLSGPIPAGLPAWLTR